MGDAGALVTDDGELADRALALREHGQRRKYEHETEGFTARLDTIQAARPAPQAPTARALERRATVDRGAGTSRRSRASAIFAFLRCRRAAIPSGTSS